MTIIETCRRPDDPSFDAPEADPAQVLLQQAPDVTMLVQPDGTCRHVTAASRWVLGRSPAEVAGTKLRDLAAEPDREALNVLLAELAGDEACASAEFRLRHAELPLWLEARGRRLPSGAGAVVTLRDITARKESEGVLQEANSLLRHRATIDIVTGLLNRDHFIATLERELRRAQRDGTRVALIALSLNQFRAFSDRYGWETADAAARLEGDEFAILLPGTDASGAELIARRITAAVASLAIAHAGAPSGLLEASTGVVVSTTGSEAYGVLRRAPAALRAAKDLPAELLAS